MSLIGSADIPSPQQVWMVAQEMGFRGGVEACTVWKETLRDGGIAINIVQLLSITRGGHA
jgi:hypothetical protein